ncbi:zinc finger protein 668-like [Haliotis rubra]|uniref:zinc finger protein 668-like n=1 Tax=Haliotis rubra TaxID=36100 RepID=UPI001EE4FA63|nr:zinc finger protein 668-like [Haliotis rubra]
MANVSLKVNFAQISVDSSKKVIDISSKYTYGINTFKRIVGAVTIIFTDNESSFDAPCNESETQHLDKTTWKNIPASLSVLPTPAYTQSMDVSRGGVGLSSHNSLPHCYENIQGMEQTHADNMDDSLGDNITAEKNQETSAVSSHANITSICSEGETIYIKKEPTSPFPEEFDERLEKSVDEHPSNVGRISGRQSQHLNGKQSDVYFDKKPPHAGHKPQSSCYVCFREIQSKREFIFHARAHKNVLGGGESCPICLKSFTRNVGLMRHSSLHITSDLYNCPVCGINIVQLDGFKRHFHKRHPGSLFKLKCYLANLRHHTVNRMASQDSARNGQMVSSASERRDSQAMQQMESEPHTAMTNNDSEDFQNRQTSYHPLSQGKSSNQMMQLQVNAEGVQSVNLLTEHPQCPDTTSSGCDSAAVEFGSEEDVHVHKNKTSPRSSSKSNGKKSAVCSFCWSGMTNMEDFLNHMEAHKNIMKVPHTCPVCLHEFSDKMRVKRHASKHVLTAMFACPFCPVQIARIDSLRRHVRKVHPAYADNFRVETNYATPPSGLVTVTEDLSVSASLDASASQNQTTEIEIKKECTTSSSPISVPRNAANCPYETDLPSEGATEGQTYFNTPTGSTAGADHQDGQGNCSKKEPELSWQENSDQQHTQINPFIPLNADNSSSPVSVSWGHTANVVSSSGRLHTPKIFNSPKRGGSRPQTDMSNVSMDIKCDPAQFHSPNSAKKKGKNNKQLTSTCFFCSSTLTNTQEFLEHARLHAKDDKITCPVCVTDYARKLGLVRHSVNHVPSDAHVCSVCGTSFARRDVMLRHYRKVHKMCLNYFRHATRNPDSGATANSHDHDDLQILSFDAITAPNIPPLPGDGDMSPAVMGVADDDDMMYSCGLCGAQYHDAVSLQEHVQNHPHDI